MYKIFPAIARNGKLTIQDRDRFTELMLKYDGREVGVFVCLYEELRTNAENRYYWGVVVKMVSDEMAILPDEAHEFLKSLFLKEGVEVNGKRWEIVRSTAALSIQKFEEYVEKCRMWASSELGVAIPLPNEIIIEV
jgi:hypothetical protein